MRVGSIRTQRPENSNENEISENRNDNNEPEIESPDAKRHKFREETTKQYILPFVPTPTEDFGIEVYALVLQLISNFYNIGAAEGIPKLFHEYGVTTIFIDSLIKVKL